jgi:hypothetical protein
MLLDKHLEYSAATLDAIRIKGVAREQICIGSKANDLCELTNESRFIFKVPPEPEARPGMVAKNFMGIDLALYQSHFGRLASMHAMAVAKNVPAAATRSELQAWFDFLNELATGDASIENASRIAMKNPRMNELFDGGSIEFEDIIDADEIDKVRYRSIGMMLHLIQDSYTASHCKRDAAGKLEQFYWYNGQDSHKHKAGDDVTPEHRTAMFQHCRTCLESVLDGVPYDHGPLLTLSDRAIHSGGGDFAK